jgi:molybdopterin converting factor small subunit
MKIAVKYGFSFRENVGVSQETLEVEEGPITVAQALDLIIRRHPVMGEFVDASSDEAQRRHLVVSVNSKLARLADLLNDGDNISLLLPVSGGHGE